MSFTGRLVLFCSYPESIVLDCVAGDRRRLVLGDHELEPGEPFSMEVATPEEGWLGPALSSLERWAADGRTLEIDLARSGPGITARLGDGATSAVFDLVGLMGRRPPLRRRGRGDARESTESLGPNGPAAPGR